MPDYKLIKVEKTPGRMDIVLNSPPVNILNIAMMEEICDALKTAAGNKSLRVLVFRAEGKHFSAGADVAEHTSEKVNEMIAVFGNMFKCISKVRAVTIAAIDGSALGGGCELATFCDIVVATDRAKIGQPEIAVGVFPPVAAVIFPYLIGRNRAIEMIVSGKVISAVEAERIGLINNVYPVEEFSARLDELVASFTSKSASVIAVTKKTINRCFNIPVQDALRNAYETYFTDLMVLEDAHEGLNAFLEKRKPAWKDR